MLQIKESNYQQLNPSERVSLTIAALSRGDTEEARRLYKTCPKYHYLATDYDFTRRLDAVTWVGEKYAELCQYYYDKILITQASISAVILAGEKMAEKMPFSCKDLEEARIGHISTLKAIHKALIEFCEEVGVSSGQLVIWMCQSAERSGIDGYLNLEGIDPDGEFALHVKNKFLAHWESNCGLK